MSKRRFIMRKTVDHARVARAARDRFALGRRSSHGSDHWQRVQDNGLRLARENGADAELVKLFAWLHDCCREHDGSDMGHGPRAAALMESLRDDLLADLEEDRFLTLQEAVRDHTSGHRHRDVTIGTCWDADRLDIGRVGSRPRRRYLSTEEAREEKVIEWAWRRSRRGRRR